MSTIPASQIVAVTPSVLAAGGTGLNGVGLMLTTSTRIPIGTVASFSSALAVSAYFGPGNLANDAAIYFAGFTGATILPSQLLMAQYNPAAVAAYLRGASLASLTLAQLQAIIGAISITVDGYPRSGNVNLGAATSFTNAATLIATALNSALPTEATLSASGGSIAAATASFTGSIAGNVMSVTSVASGTIAVGGAVSGSGVAAGTLVQSQLTGLAGGAGTYAVSVTQSVASEALTETYGLLTVTSLASGTIAVGQTVNGSAVAANTLITGLGTGAGGTGTYYLNNSQTVGTGVALTTAATAVAVTFDSVSGGFTVTSGVTGAASTIAFATGAAATLLGLTSAAGGVTSQGAAPAQPAAFMNALITLNTAWANFMTHFEPDGNSGSNAVKQAFAAWKNTALGGNRFGYVCWDPDNSPAVSNNAATSLGQILKANGDSGTALIWEGGQLTFDNGLAAFALGIAASVNFGQTNGRTDWAFREQAGLTGNVTDPTTAANLTANGYNFYGAYGAATQNFVWFQTGQITGPFAWIDSFEVQIWLNSFFQQALLTLFANALSVPFTNAGKSLIEGAMQTVITQALAFGAFAPNTLTAGQIAQVNAQAGANIAGTLQAQGYYIQAIIPNQVIQAARGPWSIIFWYIDRNSVQQITLSSVMVQ